MIKDLFAKPIDRDIKGVIKVGQDDSSNVRQELEEYVVTRELQKHFAEFFASYKRGILGTTDKMGVWISGFFGSGKSHFLKILSYLLANKNVDGKAAIDYFIDDQKIIDNITLHILTPNSDEAADEPTMRMLSGQSRCVLVVLPNDRTFLDEIRSALKIEKFIRFDAANAVTKFEQIKEAKKVEMRERSASARLFLTEAMREAAIYVNGDRAQSSAKEISSRINDALGKLVAGVYHKLPYIDTAMGENDIRKLFREQNQQLTLNPGAAAANELALRDVNDYIASNTARHLKTSMKSILDRFTKAPYGFIEADVQWLVARLFKSGDIALYVNNEAITLHTKTEDELLRCLTRKEYNEKLMAEKRVKANEKQKKAVREVISLPVLP